MPDVQLSSRYVHWSDYLLMVPVLGLNLLKESASVKSDYRDEVFLFAAAVVIFFAAMAIYGRVEMRALIAQGGRVRKERGTVVYALHYGCLLLLICLLVMKGSIASTTTGMLFNHAGFLLVLGFFYSSFVIVDPPKSTNAYAANINPRIEGQFGMQAHSSA